VPASQAALAAHQVVRLAEDPQLALQHPVQMITLAHLAGVVRVEQQVLEPLQELVPACHQVRRLDNGRQRGLAQRPYERRAVSLAERSDLVNDGGKPRGW